MKLTKIKAVRYGGTDTEFFQLRAQGVKVRVQDMETGILWIIDPIVARGLARALSYCAHHAERVILTPEIKELLNEQS